MISRAKLDLFRTIRDKAYALLDINTNETCLLSSCNFLQGVAAVDVVSEKRLLDTDRLYSHNSLDKHKLRVRMHVDQGSLKCNEIYAFFFHSLLARCY